MKRFCGLILLVLCVARAFGDNMVNDPIADFLKLPIKERYTDASELVRVHQLTFDMDGDGVDERFIGHNMMWWGDNHGWYGAFYQSANGGFIRLTPEDTAIGIDPRFFGPRETTFVGYVDEQKIQGVLVLANDFVSRDPNDPEKPTQPEQYSARKFYHIQAGHLIVDDLGPLNLHTPEGKAFFNRYFGKDVKSRSIRFEDYPLNKLKERGYLVPDWKHPPESLAVQATSQASAAPGVAQSTPTQATPSPTPIQEARQSPLSFPIVSLAILVVLIVGVVMILLKRKGS